MNPPRTVWRVERDGNNGNGIMPRGIPVFQDDEDFEAQVQRHLNWKDNAFASPFLSTFSSKTHAVRWRGKYRSGGNLYEIDTTDLEMHRRGQPDEFLIVGGIPQRDIQSMARVEDEVDRLNAAAMEID
uniref:DUF7587 domain-containing protein n=1 Tax=Globisporangium ultimum (strain ATCC 200006 / CBS 805.95 / DAOM BR144) TaxID=431595 RepID=K3XCI5_GLOUD